MLGLRGVVLGVKWCGLRGVILGSLYPSKCMVSIRSLVPRTKECIK